MEYLVVHDANLLADGSNNGYRPATVAWHVQDGVFSYPRPVWNLPMVESSFIYVNQMFAFHHQVRNLYAHLLLLLPQLLHLCLLAIVGKLGFSVCDPMLFVQLQQGVAAKRLEFILPLDDGSSLNQCKGCHILQGVCLNNP